MTEATSLIQKGSETSDAYRKGRYIHPEYRKRCTDLPPARYSSKQNTVGVCCIVMCWNLKFGSECQLEEKASYFSDVTFPKKSQQVSRVGSVLAASM